MAEGKERQKVSPIRCWLLSGAGNRFVLIDREAIAPWASELPALVPQLCQLWTPPAEGVILLGDRQGNRFVMEFWNPDGTTGMMCGNGGRCAALYVAHTYGEMPATQMQLVVGGESYTVRRLSTHSFQLDFPPLRQVDPSVVVELAGHSVAATYVDNGADHLVLWLAELQRLSPAFRDFHHIPWEQLVPPLWEHPRFRQRKVNVNVAMPVAPGVLHFRTFERGVNAETAACGTGAVAVAVAAALSAGSNGLDERVYTLLPPSQHWLTVRLRFQQGRIIPSLEGDARLHGFVDVKIERRSVCPINESIES